MKPLKNAASVLLAEAVAPVPTPRTTGIDGHFRVPLKPANAPVPPENVTRPWLREVEGDVAVRFAPVSGRKDDVGVQRAVARGSEIGPPYPRLDRVDIRGHDRAEGPGGQNRKGPGVAAGTDLVRLDQRSRLGEA